VEKINKHLRSEKDGEFL